MNMMTDAEIADRQYKERKSNLANAICNFLLLEEPSFTLAKRNRIAEESVRHIVETVNIAEIKE